MYAETVKINTLKGAENWGVWRFQVKVLLLDGEAYDVVTGVITKPTLTAGANDVTRAEYEKKLKVWTKLDSAAQKIIGK